MKNQEQVLRFISQNEFCDKNDWNNVLTWCKEHYGGGKAHRALKPIGRSTYEQFEKWLDKGPAVGDIIKSNGILGILGGYSADKAFLSNVVNDGRLEIKKTWISPDAIDTASDEDCQKVMNMIKSQKKKYSISLSRLVEVFIPNDGEFVRIIKDKKTTIGIYHACHDGEHTFYGVVSGNRFTGERLFSADEIKLDKASKSDVDKVNSVMAVNGLQWLPESKKVVETHNTRVKRGGYFWYMSERFMPESDKDTYNTRCDEKFQSGNYFISFKECYEFCMSVKELRKK